MQLPIIEHHGRKWFHRGNTLETWNPNGTSFPFESPIRSVLAYGDLLEVRLWSGSVYAILGGPELEMMYSCLIRTA